MLVDPDGRKIEFAPGTTKEQMEAFYTAVRYLDANNCGGRYGVLKNSETVYVVNINNNGTDSFDPSTKVINWDPSLALEKNGRLVMSPAAILNHEMAHATLYEKALRQYYEDFYALGQEQAVANFYKNYTSTTLPESDNPYTTRQDQYIIQGIEQRTAILCGEVQPGTVTRTDHSGGKLVAVDGPTSLNRTNTLEE